MKKYFIQNIDNNPFERPCVMLANSPIEAVKKAYPDCKVYRDTTNRGNIVVGNWFNGYHGAVYKRYCYILEIEK